jgi:hypothetical protein
VCEKVCEKNLSAKKIWVRNRWCGGVAGVSERSERTGAKRPLKSVHNFRQYEKNDFVSVRQCAGGCRHAETSGASRAGTSCPQQTPADSRQLPANSPPTPACFESILKSIFNLKATPLHLLYNSRAPFSIFRMTEINGENSIYFISSLLKISSQ